MCCAHSMHHPRMGLATMTAFGSVRWMRRIESREADLCRRVNSICRRRTVRWFFATVSRLGDGVFWYTLILLLPVVYGYSAVGASLHMLSIGAVGLLLYKYLKTHLVRERPYIGTHGIVVGARALDRYSFPSGHTLHAVGFSIVALGYYPVLAPLLVPFTALVAVSRVVLGLHYPSDVIAGAGLGALIATTSLQIVSL